MVFFIWPKFCLVLKMFSLNLFGLVFKVLFCFVYFVLFFKSFVRFVLYFISFVLFCFLVMCFGFVSLLHFSWAQIDVSVVVLALAE